jgi:tRNA A37 threonylcarbamoyladenosine dehydratase
LSSAIQIREPVDQDSIASNDPPNPLWKTEDYLQRFSSVGRLFHDEQSNPLESHSPLSRLANATVAVFGLGGVGSWAAEALVRSGVGNILLVDLDDICISNTNRQIHAMTSNVGKFKIDVMKQRLLDISPLCNVSCIHDFVRKYIYTWIVFPNSTVTQSYIHPPMIDHS